MEAMNTEGAKLPKFDLNQFKKKSKDELWAARGLGMSATAVDGWMEMFSAFLIKLGCDVGPLELERWMDTYYQLRYEAEREADTAKFLARNCEVQGWLEPVVPKINKIKVADKADARAVAEAIVNTIFKGCQCGPEVKDHDDPKDEKPKGVCKCKEFCECKGPNGESNK